MTGYVIRRSIGLVTVVLLIAVTAFLLVHLAPGDPAAIMLGPEASLEDIEALGKDLGLDRPIYVQFCKWFSHAVRGDLGRSYYYRQPVTSVFLTRIEPTLLLTAMAVVIAIIIGVPAGIIAAVRANTIIDQATMTMAVLGISIPQFWLALNMILLFAVTLGWFPPTGYAPLSSGLLKNLRYMILPSFALGFGQAALIARMTRATMLEVMGEDYIRTARAKGIRESKVILGHALRNVAIEVVTVVGLSFAVFMGGAFVLEIVFTLPGVGRLVVGAVRRRDFPVLQGALLYIGVFISLINLAVDLLYAYLDPRIKYD